MNIAFHTGASGLMAHQKDIDVLAHNMANINTVGYKYQRSSFQDLLYNEMDTNVKGDVEGDFMTGHGVKNRGADLVYTQGVLEMSASPYDFALLGEGMFAVEMPNGITSYTRSGAFKLSIEGEKGFLVTNNGGYVLDDKGKRIEVDRDPITKQFTPENLKTKLGIYHFPNPFGIAPWGDNQYLATPKSGVPYSRTENNNTANKQTTKIKESALELSTVDMGEGMVDVMVSQRAFQLSSKMVQTADQLEEIINNLR